LALAVVYFISVLMVSKYRDILEPQNERQPPNHTQSFKESENENNETPTTGELLNIWPNEIMWLMHLRIL